MVFRLVVKKKINHTSIAEFPDKTLNPRTLCANEVGEEP